MILLWSCHINKFLPVRLGSQIMNYDEIENTVSKALEINDGNTLKAKKQLKEWAEDDSDLLYGLVKPHLGAIVAYAVYRVSSGISMHSHNDDDPEISDEEEDQIGLEILKAMTGKDCEIFGSGEFINVKSKRSGKTTKASDRHIDAIRKIAGKSSGSEISSFSKKDNG